MYKDAIEKLTDSGQRKIDYMRSSPAGYVLLSALAGAYVGFGIVLIFAVGGPIAKAGDPYLKLIMGVCFGIALSLVIFAGSELFTGNNMVFAVGGLCKRTGGAPVIVLFALCYLGNFIGSAFLAWLVVKGGSLSEASQTLLLQVGSLKMNLGASELFFRGVLCNWLVCLAVWTSSRTQSDSAKLILIFWCLFAFISCGFEHSVANMTLLTLTLLFPHGPEISFSGLMYNQAWVVLGNIVGGGMMVGAVYWFASAEKPVADEKSRDLVESEAFLSREG
ncbi:MAG: formate/nitrite transporter family protein [Nitrospinae bacterium]|nr:formate/nitrite transporter family protein [Nitrospinota bacterium]